jgi:zinc protease
LVPPPPRAPLPPPPAQLIHPDALTWVVVGDLGAIEAPIRKLSIGEVKVLDADGNVLR